MTIRTLRQGEDGVGIAVADSGPGLRNAEEQEVFDAADALHSNGTAPGLAISRAIIAAHGGRLWASGQAAGGTVYQFVIPMAPGGAAADTAAPAEVQPESMSAV